jgi:hypothetical protein
VRRAARLVALLGALGVGWFVLEARPREVEIVYDLAAVPDAAGLRVQIRRGAERVRDAEFRRPGRQVRHRIELPDGEYALSWIAERPAGALRGERPLEVRDEQTIVVPLGP